MIKFSDIMKKATLEVIIEKGNNGVAHITDNDILLKLLEMSQESEVIAKAIYDGLQDKK